MRNIDNAAAALDHAWLLALGYLIESDGQMLVEVSQRPVGQKGGALIKQNGSWRIAEDPSFSGTSFRATDSFYINNAVAILRLDYLLGIYETTSEEVLAAERDTPPSRSSKLRNIGKAWSQQISHHC